MEKIKDTWELDTSTDLNIAETEESNKVKTHEEIILMIKEIKEIEETYGPFEIIDIEESEELIDVDHDELKENDEQKTVKELNKRRFKIFKVDIKTEADILAKRAEKSATFKVRFDEQGNLVNLDFKKPKPKKQTESKPGKLSGLKKLRKGKKGKGTASSDEEKIKVKKSKGSKLKGKLGKVGKLKRAIPGKKSKKEKSEKKE